MANNNKQTIAGLLILLAVVIALVVIFRPADDEFNPHGSADNTASETPPSTVTPATVDRPAPPAPAEKPPEPIDLGLSTAEMFAGLFKAIDAKESRAAGRLLKALRASKEEDVIPTAKKHFVTTSRESRPSRYIAQNYQYYMLAIFADTDPAYALENVRADWGKDGLEPAVTTKWNMFQRRSIDRLAASMLKNTTKITADGLASLIVTDLSRGSDRYIGVLTWLVENYIKEMKETELPDPWLSQLVTRIGIYWGKYSDDHKTTLQLFLRWVVDAEQFSERLRAQAAALLQTDPNSFWELMDLLANADSGRAVGQALAGLLAKRALTTEEQRIFVEAFYKRFSSDASSYSTLMNILVSAGGRSVPIENIRAFAGASITNALKTDSEELLRVNVILTYSMKLPWGRDPSSEILTLGGDISIESIVELVGRARKSESRGPGGMAMAAAGLLWETNRSISNKIADVIAVLGKYEDLETMLDTMNALEKWADDLRPSDGADVVRLLDAVFAKSEQFKKAVNLAERSYMASMFCPAYIRQLGVALAATGFPVLSSSLRNSIIKLIRAYKHDVAAGGEVDELTEQHIDVLVDKYHLSVD